MYYRPKEDQGKFFSDPKPEKKIPATKDKPIKSMDKDLKEADHQMSIYVRQKAANRWGKVQCYTCTTILRWKEMQNGHFIKRGHKALRFELDNTRPQCKICNEVKDGNLNIFEVNLIAEIGIQRVDELKAIAKSTVKFTKMDVQENLLRFKELNKIDKNKSK